MDNITLVRELLDKMGVPTHIVDETNFQKIDNGIRGLLFDNNNYTDFLNHSLIEIDDNKIYRYMDEYRCCYIVMKIPENKKFFFIGPYLLEMPTNNFIKAKIEYFKFPSDMANVIEKYYMSLPLLDEENSIIGVATVFGKCLWGDENNFTLEYMDDIFFDQVDPSNIPEMYQDVCNSRFYLSWLEDIYNSERDMMEAVQSGNLTSLSFVISSMVKEQINNHQHDTLRKCKNNLIITNTLLRKAAEQGGVHPLHFDKLFNTFSAKIEKVHSIQESNKIQEKMMKEYCFLVKKHSLSSYSTLIGKVITLIDYDITADLRLNAVAKQLFVNPSYLSSAFSSELGQTLTKYVNTKRIERAVMLLHKTDMQIQDVATSVGIVDVNYFIRLFKKRYGMTPTEYRKEIGKEN